MTIGMVRVAFFATCDPQQAAVTRHKFYNMAAAEKALIIGFHFPFPSMGHVEKDGTDYRLVPATWSAVL
jgi:hypothetical protein